MNIALSPIRLKNNIGNLNFKKQNISFGNNITNEERYYSNEILGNYALAGINLGNASNKIQQALQGNEFFINMEGYGKNETWAKEMADLTRSISKSISKGANFNKVLEDIEDGIHSINFASSDLGFVYGLKRSNLRKLPINLELRGKEYAKRYLEKCEHKGNTPVNSHQGKMIYIPKSNEEYSQANICRVTELHNSTQNYPQLELIYDDPDNYRTSNLSLAEKEFNKLKGIKNPSVDDVMHSCAIIQWLIAQETPYVRGSDSIANVLTKAIMHANNIFISPVKDGISLDFEAFDTDLDDYIEKYPDFFKVRPYKINE